MTTIVTAKALAERERKRLDVKKATYRAILEQFSRKISNAATLGLHEVILTTPRFVIGFPAYSIETATAYLARQLNRLGYTVRPTTPTSLHVTWEKPMPSTHAVVIDHSNDEQLPTLANLHKTAQSLRAKKR